MEHAYPIATQQSKMDSIAHSCGEVTVGCSNVAGILKTVLDTFDHLRTEHFSLQDTVRWLQSDQAKVAQASDEARLLSIQATERLGEGMTLISSSLQEIEDVLALVETLSTHVTGFAAAMEQVKRSAKHIGDIADTTNILALNATIEAMRAGDAGRTFAVVAEEVKGLAHDTRQATDEITTVVETLDGEAGRVIDRLTRGTETSRRARVGIASIENTLSTVSGLMQEVDSQNDQITRSVNTISTGFEGLSTVLDAIAQVAEVNEGELAKAHKGVGELEELGCRMFDLVVKSGLAEQDLELVERARTAAQEVETLTTAALDAGTLDERDLFDEDYVEVPGTSPKLYRTGLTFWADDHWRPILDRVKASDPRIFMTICDDRNGHIVTHMTEYSRPPTGDPTVDLHWSRNGRLLFNAVDNRLKASTQDYAMAVYRHEGADGSFNIVRIVSVPLVFRGRRWGEYELSYQI